MIALRAEGLVVRRGHTDVVQGADLHVRSGEVLAVLGPNGAGKSTLLAALGGRLPCTKGSLEAHGRVAAVLQTPALAQRSALNNVELALAWSGTPRRHRRTRAQEALERMRAADLSDRHARSLSGGEQRRVHLARAVAVAPDVMLLDEPFDGLDPQTHSALRDDTTDALRRSKSAVIVVLHERADAWAMADRIAIMLGGRIIADGPPQQMLDAPPTAEVARFLGYDGELRTETGVLLTRAQHVRVVPDSAIQARITRTTTIEDGLQLQVQTDRGVLTCRYPGLDLHPGDDVHVAIDGGVTFPQP